MTVLKFAFEIQEKILCAQSYKISYDEKKAKYHIKFYADQDVSVSYDIDAHTWGKMKELINYEAEIIQ